MPNNITYHFFQDEYKDESVDKTNTEAKEASKDTERQPPSSDSKDEASTSVNLIDTSNVDAGPLAECSGILSDLAGLRLDGDLPANFGSFMPSHLLQVF